MAQLLGGPSDRVTSLGAAEHELAVALSRLLPFPEAGRRAARLMEFAQQGSAGWPAVAALLETMAPPEPD